MEMKKLMLKRNKKRGFSLVEIVVVIAILAVLAGVLVPALISHVELSRMQKDESAMDEVVTSINIHADIKSIGFAAFRHCSNFNSINYDGSMAQWRDIEKGTDWKTYVPSTCIVHCTACDIPISQAG